MCLWIIFSWIKIPRGFRSRADAMSLTKSIWCYYKSGHGRVTEKYMLLRKYLTSRDALPISAKRRMRLAASPVRWRRWEQKGYRSSFWTHRKFIPNMHRIPTLRTWKSLSTRSLCWIELHDIWFGQITIWLLFSLQQRKQLWVIAPQRFKAVLHTATFCALYMKTRLRLGFDSGFDNVQ